MREFKKLFQAKRILALVLAAAMAVTAMPVTANAAPRDSRSASKAEEDEAHVQDADSAEPDDAQLDGIQSDGAETDGAAEDAQDADSADAPEQEEDLVPAETGDEGEMTPDLPESAGDKEAVTGAEENQTPKAETKQYKFDVEDTIKDVTTKEYSQGRPLFADETEASGDTPASMQVKYAILSKISLQTEDKSESYNLAWGSADILGEIKYAWKKSDGTALAAGESPKDAGEYQLAIELPAKDGEYGAADITIDFTITKATVTIKFDLETVAPGSPASAVKADDFSVRASDGIVFNYITDDAETKDVNESEASDLTFAKWEVKNVKTQAVLVATDKLNKNEDYVLTAEAVFTSEVTNADNYEIEDCEVKTVKVGSLKDTRIEIALTNKWKDKKEESVLVSDETKTVPKITAKTYDAAAVADLVKGIDYTATVTEADYDFENENKVYPEIAGAETEAKGTWHSAVYKSWTESQKPYCSLTVGDELESAPVEAGTYAYRIAYAGNKEEYAKSYADIVVEIEVVELVLKPTLKKTSFYQNQTAADVLANIGYEVYGKDDSRKQDLEKAIIENDRFWGTSKGISGQTSATQPYEPVFTVWETEVITVNDETGMEVSTNTESVALSENETLKVRRTEAVGDDTYTYEYLYEVRFSGQKAVYYANGIAMNSVDINKAADSSNASYQVDTAEDTLKNNTVSFTVSDATPITINTEDISVSNFEKKTLTDSDQKTTYTIYSKVYDFASLYPVRAAYKKAKVETADGTVIAKDVDYSLTYQWYRNGRYTNTADIEEALQRTGVPLETSAWSSISGISPYDAGIYMLEITYNNSIEGYYAEGNARTAVLYYEIEKQLVMAAPTEPEGGYTALTGTTIASFIAEASTANSEVRFVKPSGEEPTGWRVDENYDWDGDWATGTYYAVQWKVEKEVPTGNEETGNVGGTAATWQEIQNPYSATFEKDVNYRLAVDELAVRNNNYTDVERLFDPEMGMQYNNLSKDNTVPINVQEMGARKLKLDTGSDTAITVEKVYDGASLAEDADLVQKLGNIKAVEVKEDGTTALAAEGLLTFTYLYEDEYAVAPENAVNGGTYYIYASFKGSTEYAPLTGESGETEILVAEATITPRKVTVAPPSPVNVTAGEYADDVANEYRSRLEIEFAAEGKDTGVIEKDQAAFTYQSRYYAWDDEWEYGWHSAGYPAWEYNNSPMLGVYDNKGNCLDEEDDILKCNAKYTLKLSDKGSLRGTHALNYEIISGDAVDITVTRGNSTVTSVSYTASGSTINKLDSTDSKDGLKHTFTVLDGIEYSSYYNRKEEKTVSGNFVAVKIFVPREYGNKIPDTAIYRNAIEEAEGYLAVENIYNGSITVIFDAAKGSKSFRIRWEEGYTEDFTMNFPQELLLGDLKKAVAPKSIAFNSPSTKMVVGAIQNLDVKLTKVQMDDVICLAYKVSDPLVLNVSETGMLTALAPGSAIVTAYPVYLEDGIKTEIPGAKSANVKITVANVAAPKITKVAASGGSVVVQYPYIADDSHYTYGYRREVYVLEGSDRTWDAKYFESLIDSMPNEQWKGVFAVEPQFLTTGQEKNSRVFDSKKHAYINTVGCRIDGLKPTTQYTVYVRNVSLIRTLADGSEVVKSAAGNVKTFSTTKAQIAGLTSSLCDASGNRLQESCSYYDDQHDKDGIEIGGTVILERGEGFYDNYRNYYEDGGYYDSSASIQYTVDLLQGKVNLSAEGWIRDYTDYTEEIYTRLNGAAGTGSRENWMASGNGDPLDASDYEGPNLAYYLQVIHNSTAKVYDAYSGVEVNRGDYYRTTSSDYAVINNKGQITLKQPGSIRVVAIDKNTGIQSNIVYIRIMANATGIKGKTTTIEVGQTYELGYLVNYKAGSKALTSNGFYRYIKPVDAQTKAAIEEGGYFKVSDNGLLITALKAGGKCTFSLTDSSLLAAGSNQHTANVTIKSKALSPVKNLKLVDVIDNRFTISFDGSFFADGYRIEVTNARGTLIRSVYVKAKDNDDIDYARNDYNWGYRYEYDGKTGKYYGEYVVSDLTRQSKYTAKVTALYGEEPSKTASKAGSTTKLPAADKGLEAYDEKDSSTYNAGINISLLNSSNNAICHDTFVSGNSYTLVAYPENMAAKYAATDTLTWSSSDKKVASVKANSGSYSATLKALKAGTTMIEVKSSVLKQVIARYIITIRTVGDAYSTNCYYYGDNEDLRGDGLDLPTSYKELGLGNAVAVELASGESQWLVFTAPEDGTYNIYRVLDGVRYYVVRNRDLTKGEAFTKEVTISGSYYVEKKVGNSVSERTPISLGKNEVQISSGQWFVFTAEDAGIYKFNLGGYFNLYQDVEDFSGCISGSLLRCFMEEGQSVYLQSSNYGTSTYQIEITHMPLRSLTADGDAVAMGTGDEEWFSFTPQADAEYEFVLSGDYYSWMGMYNSSNISDAIDSCSKYGSTEETVFKILGADNTILLQVSSPNGNRLAVRTKASINAIETSENGTETTLSGKDSYFAFTAPKDGIYQFSSENADDVNARLITDLSNPGRFVDSDDASTGNFYVDCYLAAGGKIYLKMQSNSGGEQTVTVHVKEKTLNPITETGVPVSIAAGQSEWFCFTAGKAVDYTLLFKSEYIYCTRYLYKTLGASPGTGVSFGGSGSSSEKNSFAANETVYYKVKNTDRTTDAVVTVKVKEDTIQPVVTGSETTVTIEAGLEQWFSFTADDAAEYAFSFGSDAANCTMYYWYTDPSNSYYQNSSSLGTTSTHCPTRIFSAYETAYVKIKNNGSGDTTIAVKAKKVGTVPLISGKAEAEIYAGNVSSSAMSQVFGFTSTEDARYTFTIISDTAQCDGYLYDNESCLDSRLSYVSISSVTDENGETYYTGKSEYYVAAGTSLYWKITNLNAFSTKVTVKADKVPVAPVTMDDTNEITVASRTERWISFRADSDEDTKYTFAFTSDSSTCYAYLYKTLGAADYEKYTSFYNSYIGSSECYIPAGKTVYWKVENNNASDITVTVAISKVQIEQWPNEADEIALAANSEKWYKFTTASGGRYTFTVTSSGSMNGYRGGYLYPSMEASSGTAMSWTYNYIDNSYVYTGTADYYILPDAAVYLQIKNTGSAEQTITLKAEAVSISEWPTDESGTATVEANSTKYYTFRAAEAARYRITLTSSSNYSASLYASLEAENPTLIDVRSTVVDSSAIYVGTTEYYIPANTEIYCKVTNSQAADIDVTLKAEVIVPEVLTESEEVDFSLNNNVGKWFSFTVPQTGIYQFSVASESGTCFLARYRSMEGGTYIKSVPISSNSTGTFAYSLQEETTIYLKVDPYSSNSSFVGKLQVELTGKTQALELGVSAAVSVDTATAKYQWLEFTAEEDGRYRFYSLGEDDPKAWFFSEMDVDYSHSYSQLNTDCSYVYDDNSGDGNNFFKRISMTAGQTIYIAVGAPSLNRNIETTVYAEKSNLVETLTLDGSVFVPVDSGEYQWISFMAPETGSYRFYSKSSYDTYAWFFHNTNIGNNASASELSAGCFDKNDDDGEGNNFSKEITMEAGQIIYIAVGRYGLNDAATATVYVELGQSEEDYE